MVNNRVTRRVFEEEEEELPSLTKSDTSRSLFSSEYEDNFLSSHSHGHSSSERDGDDDPLPARRRAADAAATVDRSLRSRSSSRPRRRSSSRSRPPSSRSRSRPRSSSRRHPAAHRRRFSSDRCASLCGTTLYDTPLVAKLDTYLRSTSGLRLKTDGTCAFAFEDQRFTIEMTAATGEFLFYAGFGSLKALERRSWPRNFLRMLAAWNDELNRKHGVAERREDATGLLRIDASGAAWPRVALILYGHVGEVRDATSFGRTLDDFVDDALECADRLHGIREQEASGAKRIQGVSSSDAVRGRGTEPSLDDVAPDCDERAKAKVTGEATSESTKGPRQKGAAALTPADSHPSLFSSSDVYHATSKNRFQKLFGNILSKSGDGDAGADPAFVVDGTTAGEGHLKPTIVLSRKPPDEKGDGAAAGTTPSALRGLFRGGLGSSLQGLHRKRGARVAGGEAEHERSCDRSDRSLDLFDPPVPSAVSRGRCRRPEPAVARRRSPEASSPAAGRHPSRRSAVAGPPRQHAKRSSMHDEGGSGGQRRSGRHRDAMSQSEPILAQQR